MEFDSILSKCIADAQYYFQQKLLKHNLAYIKTHFTTLKTSITRIETIGLTLSHSVYIVEELYKRLEDTLGRVVEMEFKKLQDSLQKIPRTKSLNLSAKYYKAKMQTKF